MSQYHILIKVWNTLLIPKTVLPHTERCHKDYGRPRDKRMQKKSMKCKIQYHQPGKQRQSYSHYYNAPYTMCFLIWFLFFFFHSLTFLTVHNPCNKIQCLQYNNKHQQGSFTYSSKLFSLTCDQTLKNMLFCSCFCHANFCIQKQLCEQQENLFSGLVSDQIQLLRQSFSLDIVAWAEISERRDYQL